MSVMANLAHPHKSVASVSQLALKVSLCPIAPSPTIRARLDVLLEQPVYNGGDLRTDVLRVLHGYGTQVPGRCEAVQCHSFRLYASTGNNLSCYCSVSIAPGLYCTEEITAAANMVRGGEAYPEDFKFFLGHCSWTSDELATVLCCNVWFAAAPIEPWADELEPPDHHRGSGTVARLALQHGVRECDRLWPQLIAGLGGKQWADIARFEPDNMTLYHLGNRHP